jgi:two-component system sensor histidine kinase GlrK
MKSRSILQLIITGFTLVFVPLIAVVVTAVIQVDHLAKRNQNAVLDAEMAAKQSNALSDHANTMERSLGQFHVLGEKTFYDTYLFRRDEFHNAAKQLRILKLGPQLQRDLAQLIAHEQEIHKRWGIDAQKQEKTDPELNAKYLSLNEKVNDIVIDSRKLVQLEAKNGIKAAENLQQILLLQAAAVIPATILIAILFAYLITRSIKKLDDAIRDLGAGEFTKPIKINGPNDLAELGERLDWLRKRICELEDQKINFLRHISHELKTPLTAVREASELLIEEDDSRQSEETEIIQIIHESSLQLQMLIEDLLQFGRNKNLLKPLEKESIHLPSLIKKVIAEYSLALSNKKINLSTQLDNVVLHGDYERLRVVLNNLISNAVRYSPNAGEIRVDLSTNNKQMVLDIENSGPGINQEDQSHAFEPFYRGNSIETGPVKGTGLGLTIVKEHIEAHQGKIQILNGKLGAFLRVYLPLRTI